MRRRLLGALLAPLCLTVLLATAPAPVHAADSTAVAVNTHDGMDLFRLAFRINRVMSDTVDTANAAVAVSSCSECQTVAIAIQVVLILSDPTVVAPENLALALNVECSLCSTLASAYQLVMTTGGPVRFTAEGSRQIADIRRRLLELRDSDLSVEELAARVKELTTELAQVVATQLVTAGQAEPPTDREAPGDSTTTTTTTATGGTSGPSSPTTGTTGTTSPTTSSPTSSTSSSTSSTSAPTSSTTTSPTTTSPSTTTTTAATTTTEAGA